MCHWPFTIRVLNMSEYDIIYEYNITAAVLRTKSTPVIIKTQLVKECLQLSWEGNQREHH